MALHFEIADGALVIRSVGEHDFDEGRRQFDDALEEVRKHVEATGEKLHVFADMKESEERRKPTELISILDGFKSVEQYLTRFIAILVRDEVVRRNANFFKTFSSYEGFYVMVNDQESVLKDWLMRMGGSPSNKSA